MNFNLQLISVIAVVLVLGAAALFVNPSELHVFTIWNPTAPAAIDDYVNSYYFPMTSKTVNTDSCSVPSIKMGASFAWDSTKLPTSKDYMYSNNQYYKVNRVTGSYAGSCTKIEGEQILVDGKAPFKNFLLIQKGTNFIICQNLDGNKYKYSQLAPVKTPWLNKFYIRYSLPQVEPEGKYFCDSRSGKIYRVPCGSKTKELIETCQLGCEAKSEQFDANGEVDIVKCKGDYKPNKQVCSGDGKTLYKIDSVGKMTQESCCSCKDAKCSKTVGCEATKKECTLIKGDGKNQINVFLSEYQNHVTQAKYISDNLPTQVPYNEFTFNFYTEKTKGDCNGIVKQTSKDIRVDWKAVCPQFWACGMYTYKTDTAGWVSYTRIFTDAGTQHFLMLHEFGHVYLHFGHTCDNSIMDWNGGSYDHSKAVYQPYQVLEVRKHLNTTTVWTPPSSFGAGTACGGRR